ncbi:hypothetical protein PUNSTDRAFT_51397 [Punctularia strigosozonata HHB-11173 SS5]|uniref:uncharacterized protein n=1 Tax=Punctularia strigosozonata (strain HHB-11173) TaxID=741275 RepID=UPI0004416928|nr:uncharacterized protein PUNSTDRAFT_51397 [Punctularia strigosozonata HHB-11173 SS5]EIN10823.1 hypothetical protein PUNSTDRAFT_51397 [Punctularia strigosozonata HHB-11173 SS5]
MHVHTLDALPQVHGHAYKRDEARARSSLRLTDLVLLLFSLSLSSVYSVALNLRTRHRTVLLLYIAEPQYHKLKLWRTLHGPG